MKGNYHFDSLRLLYNYLWKTPNNSPRGNTHTRPSSNFALARYCLRMYAVSTP